MITLTQEQFEQVRDEVKRELLDSLKDAVLKDLPKKSFLTIGKVYSFRTVTMIYSGILAEESDDAYLLKNAAWIAETARWSDYIKNSDANEIEPYGVDIVVFKSGMLDIAELPRALTEQK